MVVPIPKIHSYWISLNQTIPPVSPLGPQRSLPKMGRARWATLEACGLLVSLINGQIDGFPTGLPTPPHGKPIQRRFHLVSGMFGSQVANGVQFQTDSPMLLPLCEPLRKIYLERISVFKRFYLFNCILEWMTQKRTQLAENADQEDRQPFV